LFPSPSTFTEEELNTDLKHHIYSEETGFYLTFVTFLWLQGKDSYKAIQKSKNTNQPTKTRKQHRSAFHKITSLLVHSSEDYDYRSFSH
jgi:hypothetical protein